MAVLRSKSLQARYHWSVLNGAWKGVDTVTIRQESWVLDGDGSLFTCGAEAASSPVGSEEARPKAAPPRPVLLSELAWLPVGAVAGQRAIPILTSEPGASRRAAGPGRLCLPTMSCSERGVCYVCVVCVCVSVETRSDKVKKKEVL